MEDNTKNVIEDRVLSSDVFSQVQEGNNTPPVANGKPVKKKPGPKPMSPEEKKRRAEERRRRAKEEAERAKAEAKKVVAESKKAKSPKKPSSEDNGKWDSLYRYVCNLMYDFNEQGVSNISTYCIHRLRGMAQNAFVSQNVDEYGYVYGYEAVETAFRHYEEEIKYILRTKSFINCKGEYDDKYKVNYICKIVEGYIPTAAAMHMAANQALKLKAKLSDVEIDEAVREYVKASELNAPKDKDMTKIETNKLAKKYEEMW